MSRASSHGVSFLLGASACSCSRSGLTSAGPVCDLDVEEESAPDEEAAPEEEAAPGDATFAVGAFECCWASGEMGSTCLLVLSMLCNLGVMLAFALTIFRILFHSSSLGNPSPRLFLEWSIWLFHVTSKFPVSPSSPTKVTEMP